MAFNRASLPMIKILPLQKEHIHQAVEVHIRSFPNFFLTFLGPKFLKIFYSSFVENKDSVGLVALDEQQKVVGVIVGPLQPQGYFKRLLLKRWWAFGFASLAALMKKPSIIKRLFRAIFYRGDSPPNAQGLALLSSIAVAPEYQAKGIGSQLIRAFVEKVRQQGREGVYLTTDAVNNDAVNKFYQKIGFALEATYTTPEGRKMNRYLMRFANDDNKTV